MNVPSYNALIERDKLIKTVQELCEQSNSDNAAVASLENGIEVAADGGVYIKGVGGYDGTNAGESGVKTLQEVLEDMAG